MRLFLYLVALVAGFSPAEASRVAMAQPVAVGAVAQTQDPTAVASTHKLSAHAAFLAQPGFVPSQTLLPPVFSGFLPPLIGVELTDRPRA